MGFHADRQILRNIFHQVGVIVDRFQNGTVHRYCQGGAVCDRNHGKGIITSLLHSRSTFKDEVIAAGGSHIVDYYGNLSYQGLDFYRQVGKGCAACHHSEGFIGIKGSQIYFKCVRAVCEAIGTDTNFTVAPIILAVPNLGTAQITGQGDIQMGITCSDQILGGGKTELVVACGAPANGLLVHIGNSQGAIPLVPVGYPIQQLKAGGAGLIHVEAEYLVVGRYIVIPGPAAVYITAYGIHGTAPAPKHRTGVFALGNIVGVHQPCTLTGIVLHHIFLKPGSGRGHTKVVAGSLQHIVAVLDGKVHIGAALCPTQGFCTLISLGRTDRHISTHIDKGQCIPGIAVVELIQVNTQVLCARSEVAPVAIPSSTMDEATVSGRIDGKYQVGITLIP